jgi:hypothetical protein
VVVVKFTDPAEFLAELTAEAGRGRIEDRIVRAACSRRAVPGHMALT